MSYIVNRTDGNIAAVVYDGVIDTTTSLNLVGKGYSNYAETIAENFVSLLENSANSIAPRRPLPGQLWYNKTVSQLEIFNGTQFTTVNNVNVSDSSPVNPVTGDFWYNTTKKQLFFYKESMWQLISPAYSRAQGQSELLVETLTDNVGNLHTVVSFFCKGLRTIVISSDAEFNTVPVIDGFPTIYPGINLSDNTSAVQDSIVNGTATYALTAYGLDEISDATYMHANADTSTVGTLSVVNDGGIAIGSNGDVTITTLIASPYTFGSSITATTDKSLALVGYGGSTLMLDNATNWIAINKLAPTVDLDVGGAINADEYIVSQGGYYFADDSEIVSSDNVISINPGGVTAITADSNANVSIDGFTTLNNDVTVSGNVLLIDGQLTLNQYHETIDGPVLHPARPTEDNHVVTRGFTTALTQQNMLPIGSVIMWYGSAGTVPLGWHICDGTNGTPDLRNKFVMGAGIQAVMGEEGGSNTADITTNTAGSHRHLATTEAGGAHDHTGNTGGHALTASEVAGHTHNFSDLYGLRDDANPPVYDRNGNRLEMYTGWGSDGDADSGAGIFREWQTDSTGDSAPHIHPISNSGTHTHAITSETAGAHSHTYTIDSRPQWFALYYIMRVSNDIVVPGPVVY
jgi:hypothetical protein